MSYKDEVRERDKVCQNCGSAGSRHNRLQVHHIIYKCMGGPSLPDNCVLLCEECHRLIHMDDKIIRRSKKRNKRRRRKWARL
jgi:5-methylcytosine-specific restriction endonuclease McrA